MSEKGDFLSPIREFPRRVRASFTGRVRRRNTLSRIVETYIPVTALFVLAGVGWWAFVWGAAAVLGELALYEFVLEPAGWAGYWWERGPRDGETFDRE